MKKFLAFFMILFVCAIVCAAEFHSVPLDSEAYRIIEVGVIRGIIPPQTDVKPYNLDLVRDLLLQIRNSESSSKTEKKQIDNLFAQFDRLYGKAKSETFKEILDSGFYKTVSADGKTNAAFGIGLSTNTIGGMNLDGEKILDSRNKISGSLRGDIAGVVSYDMTMSGILDKLEEKAFVDSDYYTECEGKYLNLFDGGSGLETKTSNGFWFGYASNSELSTSLGNGIFSARIGSIKHDWGVGNGNIALSKTARSFDAFEFSLKPTDWVSLSAITGSLGKFGFGNEQFWPSDNWHEDLYDNNFALHRVEFGPFSGAKFTIWESVVYRKRFEMAYLNPLQIYMFAQNSLGDFDNMIAGFDFSYTAKNIGIFYFQAGLDEMNSFKKVFSCPRNILAVQVGFKGSVKLLDFTTFGIQGTYISPFFGTHYGSDYEFSPAGNMPYKTTYVNKGQNLGYALDPDSIELLVTAETSYKGFNFSLKAKDEIRSYQYATDTVGGQNMLTTMCYSKTDLLGDDGMWGEYYSKDFFNNIGENILSVEVNAEKAFENLPFTVSLGLNYILDSFRTITNLDVIKFMETDKNGNAVCYNFGNPEYSNWTTEHRILGAVTCKINFQ